MPADGENAKTTSERCRVTGAGAKCKLVERDVVARVIDAHANGDSDG